MGNNLIKLTGTDGAKVIINSMLIESIVEVKDGSFISIGFGSRAHHNVTETPDEVVKKIEKGGYFKTTTYSNGF